VVKIAAWKPGDGSKGWLINSKRGKPALAELLEKYDPVTPRDRDIAPVGREFGSPDYDRLMAQDQAAFRANLAKLVKICSELAEARVSDLDADERRDAENVQIALKKVLAQQVSFEVAAEVWRHYSNAVLAGWLTGADTVASAKDALYSYCLHAPAGGFTPEPPGPAGFD